MFSNYRLIAGHGIEAQGKMISTVCNQSTAEISFSDDSSERRPTFQALEFVCSYLNYTVVRIYNHSYLFNACSVGAFIS